jgi:hypothetical protein
VGQGPLPTHGCRCALLGLSLVLAGILRFCGDMQGNELPTQAVAVETAQKLLHQVQLHLHRLSLSCIRANGGSITVVANY